MFTAGADWCCTSRETSLRVPLNDRFRGNNRATETGPVKACMPSHAYVHGTFTIRQVALSHSFATGRTSSATSSDDALLSSPTAAWIWRIGC